MFQMIHNLKFTLHIVNYFLSSIRISIVGCEVFISSTFNLVFISSTRVNNSNLKYLQFLYNIVGFSGVGGGVSVAVNRNEFELNQGKYEAQSSRKKGRMSERRGVP